MYRLTFCSSFLLACIFHNWIRKLIMRLKKYQARGIDVIGAPAIGDDFEINEYALQSHGG